MNNIEKYYNLFCLSSGVCTDTRNIIPKSIYIGLKGENFDGNLYAEQAIKGGCLFAFVEDKTCADNKKIFYVENTLLFLQKLANFHRNQFDIPIIAITGTNGKTTTKELVAAILNKKYNVIFTKGNFNNHIGVPLTLLQINKQTDIAVVEMGASHVKEIETLCNITEPQFGLITNVGIAHIEGFGSFEAIVNTKTELYRYLKTVNGVVFYNSENVNLVNNLPKINSVSYGTQLNCTIIGQNPESKPYLNIEFKEKGNNITNKICTNLVGKYNFENVLAAICIGNYFKVNTSEIIKAVENYFPSNNRSQVVKTKQNTLIVDAYNANPSSMNIALDNFFEQNVTDKCLIIGDMLELGVESENEHKKIYNKILNSGISDIILVGKIFNNINDNNLNSFLSVDQLIEHLKTHKITNKNILIKASHGIHLEKIIEYL